MRTRLRLLVFLAIAVGAVTGCGRGDRTADTGKKPTGSTQQTPAKKKGTIGLSVLTLTNPFFKVIADSMTAEAARHGYDVIVVSGEFDVARQQNQVKDFIVKRVAAIVLTPCDSKAIGPAIKEANAVGIPVFTADIACLAPDARVVCHVATDNYQGGRMAAQAMIEALGGKGKVAIIDHPEVESVILRTKGFADEIAEANKRPGVAIRILGKWPGGAVPDKSFNTAQDILQGHADLDGMFAINDPTAMGAIAALEKAGKIGQVKLVAFDGQPEGKQAIKDGKIYADPVQFPDQIGAQTVQVIVSHFEGKETPKEILIPTALYRKADALKDTALK
jgi:ribose transport system substrate-binding protein